LYHASQAPKDGVLLFRYAYEQRSRLMSSSTLIRLGGLAAMTGGVLFVAAPSFIGISHKPYQASLWKLWKLSSLLRYYLCL
jgi:hypothetical protein